MATPKFRMKWDDRVLRLSVEGATEGATEEIARRIIDTAEPPQDTGFLKNSGYVRSSRQNTFSQTWSSGKYLSRRSGRLEQRERIVDPPEPPKNGAIAGFGAIYAFHVESEQPFLYPATEGVAGREAEAIIAKHRVK